MMVFIATGSSVLVFSFRSFEAPFFYSNGKIPSCAHHSHTTSILQHFLQTFSLILNVNDGNCKLATDLMNLANGSGVYRFGGTDSID